MQLNQVLAGDELIWITNIENLAVRCSLPLQVLTVEIWSHFTLHLNTLHFSQVSLILQVLPVGLIQLRSNQKVQFSNSVVLPNKSGGEPQFTVRLDEGDHLTEGLSRNHLHFVKNHQAPINILDFVKLLIWVLASN